MHIGIDLRPLSAPYRTGVGEYTLELVRALTEIDRTNNYLLFSNGYRGSITPFTPAENVRLVTTRYPNKLFNASICLAGRPQLDQLVARTAGLAKPLGLFFAPNLGFTALNKRTRFILAIHDLSFEFFPDFFSLKQRWWHRAVRPREQCHRADSIITPSEHTKNDLVLHYGVCPEKITVVAPGVSCLFHNPADTEQQARVAAKYGLTPNFILFVGTIEPRKNLPALIQGLELFYRHQANTAEKMQPELVIVGATGHNQRWLLSFLDKTTIRSRVRLLGYIPAEDKPHLYRLARLFIYPSFYEGFGLPVLEAMTVGTPVITSYRSALPEITGKSAYFVNPNKPYEITEGIERLIKPTAVREQMIKEAKKNAAQFSWRKAAELLLRNIASI